MKYFLWGLLVALLITQTIPVEAQQTGARPYHVEAGPFAIGVYSNPSQLSLGTIDYTITLADPLTLEPVKDARVLIKAVPAENGRGGQAIALHTPSIPGRYTARVELDKPGVWKMSVEVSNPQGHVEVEAPSQVVPTPRQSRAGGLVFIGAFAAIALGVVYLTWTIRRTQKRREANSAT